MARDGVHFLQVVYMSVNAHKGSASSHHAPQLAEFPKHGALHPIAEHALNLHTVLAGAPGGLAPATCTLSVLAASPWLPQADWPAALTAAVTTASALQAQDATQRAMQLTVQLEAVNVALVHAPQAGATLAVWLADLFAPRNWHTLADTMKVHLLLHLPAALRALPSAAQAQPLARVRDAANATGSAAALLRCSSALGLHAAAKAHAHQTCQTSSGSSSTQQKQQSEALLATIRAVAQSGLQPPSDWARPLVRPVPAPSNAHWRLVCGAQDWAGHNAPPTEAALKQTARACKEALLCNAQDVERQADTLLCEVTSSRCVCALPQMPTLQELQSWAWHALASAQASLPIADTADTLHSGPTVVSQPAAARQRGHGDRSEEPTPGSRLAGWLTLATLHGVQALLQPAISASQLRRLVSDLTSLHTVQQVREQHAVQQWQTACCVAGAALSASAAALQREVLVDVLRNIWAGWQESGEPQQQNGSAQTARHDAQAQDCAILNTVRLQLACMAAIAWELNSRDALGCAGLPWMYDAVGASDCLSADAEAHRELGSCWLSVWRACPVAVRLVLMQEGWSDTRREAVRLLSELYRGCLGVKSYRSVTCVLADMLSRFWVELQPRQQIEVLPVLGHDWRN